MNWVKDLVKIIPAVVTAVRAAEKLITGIGKGKEKKEVAIDLIGTAIESIEELAGKDLMAEPEFKALIEELIETWVAIENYMEAHKALKK